MTRRERAQVAELLRCAAELDGRGVRPPLSTAIRRTDPTPNVVRLADRAALEAMEDYAQAGLPCDWPAWLEAAARVEEGTWP